MEYDGGIHIDGIWWDTYHRYGGIHIEMYSYGHTDMGGYTFTRTYTSTKIWGGIFSDVYILSHRYGGVDACNLWRILKDCGYGVAAVRRIDKIIGLFCRISSLL